MKKVFKMEDLDCAHCAAKMEEKIKKIDGVINADINFLAEKLVLEAEDEVFDAVLCEVIKVCKSVEPDCNVIVC